MKPLLIVILLNLALPALAQEEGYAVVSSITNNTLTLDNCADAFKSFKVNQKVIVVQKEAATNVVHANYAGGKGNASAQVPRKYVVLTITEVERSEDMVISIKVSRDLQNSFFINSMAGVEVRIVNCKWNW